MKGFGKILVVIVLALNFLQLNGQINTKTNKALSEAQKYYDEGLSEEVPGVLRPLIKEGFSKEQKLKAYHLLIKAYLFDDLQQDAKAALNELLLEFPEFTVSSEDPKELEYLYNQFNIVNHFSYGVLSGINLSIPHIDLSYNGNGSIGVKETLPSTNIQIGGVFELPIIEKLNLSSGIIYISNKYGFEQSLIDGTTSLYNEKINQLMIPIWVKPYMNLKKHLVYLNIGGGIDLPLSANADLELNSQSSSFDVKDKRTTTSAFVGGGAGFSYKIPMGFLSLECNYLMGLGSVVESGNRNDIPDMESTYFYLDDDFKLNNIMFSISYRHLLYKIK